MEKKIYSEPQIQILEIDVEDTMVNKTSTLHDQNQIVVDPTTIGKGNANNAASKITINGVWDDKLNLFPKKRKKGLKAKTYC